jgi:hypothetical protein
MSYPWGEDQAYGQSAGYGMVYSGMLDGRIWAMNATTGKTVWSYYSGNASYSQYGTFPFWGNIVVADGKVYSATGEHTVPNPIPYGFQLYCLNATTGDLIWRADGLLRGTHWGGYPIIGDSIIAAMNTYDEQIYAIGRGPSSTTVEAPMTGATVGNSIMIRGIVNDVSPGTQQAAIALRFPNGVPAVSDGNMTGWMQYVYQQASKPTDVKGVPVTISVVDANGNYRTIGTAISDASGTYSFAWSPDIAGTYTVTATFTGSASYYGSSAETAFVAEPPQATAAPQATQAPSIADQYFLPAVIGIIIAIIIVGLATILALRKRP